MNAAKKRWILAPEKPFLGSLRRFEAAIS